MFYKILYQRQKNKRPEHPLKTRTHPAVLVHGQRLGGEIKPHLGVKSLPDRSPNPYISRSMTREQPAPHRILIAVEPCRWLINIYQSADQEEPLK